jgi:hypothetical protein
MQDRIARIDEPHRTAGPYIWVISPELERSGGGPHVRTQALVSSNYFSSLAFPCKLDSVVSIFSALLRRVSILDMPPQKGKPAKATMMDR